MTVRDRLGAGAGWVRDCLMAVLHSSVARRRGLAVLALFLVLAYVLGVLSYVLLTPDIGIRCAFTPVVNHFSPEYLYPPGQEPLRSGDTIVQMAEQEVASWPELLRELKRLNTMEPPVALSPADLRGGGDGRAGFAEVEGQKVVRVGYLRPGESVPRAVWCRLSNPPLETLVPSLLWLMIKMGLFAVGMLVFWKRPGDRSATQLLVFCIVSVGAYIGGYHWQRIVTQPALLIVFMLCALLLPAVSLHFYLVFPRPKAMLERRPWQLPLLIYGPPLAFFVLLLTGYLRVRWLNGAGQAASAEAAGLLLWEMLVEIYVAFGVSALWYLASICCLVHSYRTAADLTERNQVKWILFGGVAALVPIGYTLYLAVLRQDRFGGGGATWPMFAASICVTGAFTISITRYRLMQLDQLVSSGAMYFLISSVAGLVYYGLVFAGMLLVGSQVGDGPSLGQVLAVSSTALVLLLTLDLARSRLKTVLDRHFRREKHQLDHTLERMRRTIEQLVDPPALAHHLLQTSGELFGVERGAVYLRQGEPPLYTLVSALGSPPPLTELSTGCPLVGVLSGQGSLEAQARLRPPPAGRQLHYLGGEVAQAMRHEGQLLGFLVLGARKTGSFSREDLALLSAFAQLTSLALISAEGHRTIEMLNGELQAKVEKIAEQQRRILALQSQLTRFRKTVQAADGEDGAAAAERGTGKAAAGEPGSSREGMIGSSVQVRDLLQLVRKVASSSSAVLLRGESGTGKGVLARLIHDNSPRASHAFVKVHCAALSPSLLESELFGHIRGAFTGAIRDKTGRFEAAHGGTLFLDEIGDISLDVQTKLLRVLQEMTFERVGSSEPIQVDVRIIAATHQNLEELIRQGRFREDLFYRLNVFPIHVPPLRQRIEDIPELALHFLQLYGRRAGRSVTGIEDDALALLKAYSWPGNIRQLENIIERAVVIADSSTIRVQDIPGELREWQDDEEPVLLRSHGSFAVDERGMSPTSLSLVQLERAERERREREQLVRALAAAGGNKAEAARALGVARSTLVSKLKKHGLG